MKTFIEAIRESQNIWDKYEHKLPSYFTSTWYALPTKKQIDEFKDYNLSADDIYQGLCYSLIGKGMHDNINHENIIKAAQMLCDAYPDNEEYKKALSKEQEYEVTRFRVNK